MTAIEPINPKTLRLRPSEIVALYAEVDAAPFGMKKKHIAAKFGIARPTLDRYLANREAIELGLEQLEKEGAAA